MKGRWPTLWLYGALMREAGLSPSDVETVNNGPAVIKGFNDQGLYLADKFFDEETPLGQSLMQAKMPAVWGLTQRERAIVYSALQWVADDPHWARETLSKIPQEPVGFPGVTLAEFNELVRKFE